jgi:hypothetical protein
MKQQADTGPKQATQHVIVSKSFRPQCDPGGVEDLRNLGIGLLQGWL